MNTLRTSLFLPDSRRAENAGVLLLLLWTVLAPLPWGGVTPPERLVLALFSATLLLLSSATPGARVGGAAFPAACLLGIAILGVLQLVPLPAGLLGALSPGSLRTYHAAAEVLALYGRHDGASPRISLAPEETVGTLLLAACYAALLISSARLLRGRGRRRVFAALLLASMSLQTLLGATRLTFDGRLHGSFVNPNHFGGYLGIGLATAFGLLWGELLTGRDRTRGVGETEERFERRFLPLAARLAAWSVLALGIALTKSRGAILAAALVTLALPLVGLFHARVRSRRRRLAIAIAAVLLAGLALIAATAGREPLARFVRSDPGELRADARLALWEASLDAWRRFPVLGSGLGTFREAFRAVQPREIEGQVEQAHNDFLQILVTGGIVGAALAVVGFVATLWLLLRAWWRQMHREESAFLLGAFGAVLFVLLHGSVEFDMSIPAIPATLAVVVGGAWAAGRVR